MLHGGILGSAGGLQGGGALGHIGTLPPHWFRLGQFHPGFGGLADGQFRHGEILVFDSLINSGVIPGGDRTIFLFGVGVQDIKAKELKNKVVDCLENQVAAPAGQNVVEILLVFKKTLGGGVGLLQESQML